MRFNDMPISDGTKDAIAAMGYDEATPIQRDAIPLGLEGRDVIGRAKTGTGKTAAFGIPMVEALRQDQAGGVQALVLCPTRELALQVSEVLVELARASPIRVVPIYGGTGFQKQIDGLSQPGPLIVVACPGRLLDLHQRGDVSLAHVRHLVLDEADRMLDMGFIHDMKRILKLVPSQRQTCLFSATLDARVRGLAKDFMHDAAVVEVDSGPAATELTQQFHVRVEKGDKQATLLTLLHVEQPAKAVVFTRTKHLAKRLAQKLDGTGWSSVALQGNMSQPQRERAMAAFREGKARILVATDVAARGLDVPDITHVVNYDIPMEPEAYVHRIGRTGRNGQTGRGFTFVQSDEHKDWKIIQQIAGLQVPRHDVEPGAEADGPDPKGQAAGATQAPQGGGGGGGGGRRGGSRRPQGSGAPRGPQGSGGSRRPQAGGTGGRAPMGGRRGPSRSGGGGPSRSGGSGGPSRSGGSRGSGPRYSG